MTTQPVIQAKAMESRLASSPSCSELRGSVTVFAIMVRAADRFSCWCIGPSAGGGEVRGKETRLLKGDEYSFIFRLLLDDIRM